MIARTIKGACLLSIIFIESLLAQDAQDGAAVADETTARQLVTPVQVTERLPEFSIGTIFAAIKTSRLGENQRTPVWTNELRKGEPFFFIPALLPEWEAYRSQVEAYCGAAKTIAAPQQPQEFVELPNSTAARTPTLNPLTMSVEEFQKALEARIYRPTVVEVPRDVEKDVFMARVMAEPADIAGIITLDRDQEKQVSLPLEIVTDDPQYRRELLDTINTILTNRGQTFTLTDDSLFPIPHDVFRIILNIDDQSRVLYQSISAPQVLDNGVSYERSKAFTLDTIIEANIVGGCSMHRRIADESRAGLRDLLVGELYRTGAVYSRTNVLFASQVGIIDRIASNLFTEESTQVEVKSAGNAGGLSINIPLVGGLGGGSSVTSSEFFAHRLVSRDLFAQAIEDAAANTAISCDGEACLQIMPGLYTQLFSQTAGKAYLVRNEETNLYKLISDQIDYVTLTDSDLASQLDNKFKNISDQDTSGQATIGVGGEEGFNVNAQQTNKLKTEFENDTKAKLDATDIPIAVTADLLLLTEERFRESVNIAISFRLPVEGSQSFYFSFLYPHLGYRRNTIRNFIESRADMAEADRLKELERACTAKELTIVKTVTAKQKHRGNSPEGWTPPLFASAREGYYIPLGWTVSENSSHNGKTQQLDFVPTVDGVSVDGQPQMYQSIGYRFYCYRGNNPVSRRNCTAAGSITYKQEPLQCASFLIKT